MTHARYTPQMVVATVCVLLLPAAIVSILHAHGTVTSFWMCVPLALCLTFLALTLGTSYWRRRRPPATVLFSDLMIWGWIRDQYIEHKIAAALRSLDRLGPGEAERRRQVLREIAAAVDAKDPFLTGHSQRVARYVTGVAGRMPVERSQADRIRTAALLHDVGKLHTPIEILMSRAKLPAEDTAIMRRHAEDGAAMVATLTDPDLAGIVRHHHERFDGSGYPDGLSGDSIPLGSRIIAVPDTFDAMTSARPYRAAMPHEAALAVLRNEAGAQFDPAVVHAFIADYTDRRGVMLWAGAQQVAPVVRVISVAFAAVVLNAFTFMVSTRASTNLPPGSVAPGSVQQTSRLLHIPARTAARQAHTGGRSGSGARDARVQRSAPASAPTLQTPGAIRVAAKQPTAGQAIVRPGPGTNTPRPVNQLQLSRPGTPPVALAPDTVAASRSLGTALSERASALTTPPTAGTQPADPIQPTPGPGPTQPTTSTTTPPSSTSPTTPTPPANADQCKNGGWQTLGFPNQGQCIASINTG